jgi:hypothetical protein
VRRAFAAAIVVALALVWTPSGSANTSTSAATTWRRLDDGRLALALRSAPPSWLTPQLIARARNGSTAAPAAAAPDVPASGFVGIRPGTFEVFPYGCTLDFVLRNGSQIGIATAGHCVDKVGQHVTVLTVAPGTSNPVLVDIGTVAVEKFDPSQLAPDYSIIAIRPALYPWVFSTIAQVGGPCGAYTGDGLAQVPVPKVFKGQEGAVEPEVVFHYGHGLGIGTGGTPRAGVSLYWDKVTYWWDSPSTPGDSGSPVRVSNLKAAGNLTDLVVYSDHPGALVEGTRISTILSSGWSLVNSPYCL